MEKRIRLQPPIRSSSRRRAPRGSAIAALRPFLPEVTALAAALGMGAIFSHGFAWPWYRAVLVGLVLAGLGLVSYGLAIRAAHDAHEAESSTLRARRLYELTRRTLEMDLHEEPGARLSGLIREIFDLDAVAVFDADLHEVYTAGDWKTDPAEMAQNVYHFGTSDDDRSTGISRRVIHLGAVPIGSLVTRGESSPLASSAIAALIAITFDRYRALANESRIEAEREAEQLRATVLDSLAHDIKTPLTAIRAASTGLSEMGRLSSAQQEMVALIDEQATLLADLTTRLLTTARPDQGEGSEAAPGVILHLAPERVDELIEEALESLADRSAATRVEIEVPPEPLVLDCDRRLIGMLLNQYLDNACKYAEFDSTITVRASKSENEVLLSVHSFGPVIPLADRERIFDRYFRSSSASGHSPGTGIGLSIAKRAALAHGGSVWVSSGEAEGNTFFAALPAARVHLDPHSAERDHSAERQTTGQSLNDEEQPEATSANYSTALERSIP